MLLGFLPVLGPTEIIWLLAAAVCFVWPACRICAKAGFPASMGLMAAIPLLNLVLLVVLAFAEWPALRGRRSAGTDA